MTRIFSREEQVRFLDIPTLRIKNAALAIKSRDFALSLKAVSEEGELEGHASVFGVRDTYNEVCMPGCFVESLVRHKREGTKPLMLWQHNPEPLPENAP